TRQLLRLMRRDHGAVRLESLQRTTVALANARTRDQVAELAVRLGTEGVGAAAASMWLVAADGSVVLAASQQRASELIPVGREIAMIERQAGHLTHIVDDLLDVSRITQGKITLRRVAVDVASAVADALDAVRPHVVRQNHVVQTNLVANLLVDADRHRFDQV